MSELHEAVTWLVYAIAGVVIIAATAGAILFGLALRFVAALLRDLGDDRDGEKLNIPTPSRGTPRERRA